ncbi:MAG TPA: cupin domain-containing protein [Edaphobacter sp.]|nr:cupin domain-containing protein [Edaphobacter sp.]
MDRREFAGFLPVLLAGVAALPEHAEAASLPPLESGVFKAGPPSRGAVPKRISQRFAQGMLKAGNIRLEIHETTQEVGAPHEPIESHLHSEIWLVREGTVELTVNGTAHRLSAGEMGLCVAGDKHYIQNVGDTPASYFVVTVGPPE